MSEQKSEAEQKLEELFAREDSAYKAWQNAVAEKSGKQWGLESAYKEAVVTTKEIATAIEGNPTLQALCKNRYNQGSNDAFWNMKYSDDDHDPWE